MSQSPEGTRELSTVWFLQGVWIGDAETPVSSSNLIHTIKMCARVSLTSTKQQAMVEVGTSYF